MDIVPNAARVEMRVATVLLVADILAVFAMWALTVSTQVPGARVPVTTGLVVVGALALRICYLRLVRGVAVPRVGLL